MSACERERGSVCVRERVREIHERTRQDRGRNNEVHRDRQDNRKKDRRRQERRKEIKPNQNIALLSNETGVQCSGINGQINLLLKP